MFSFLFCLFLSFSSMALAEEETAKNKMDTYEKLKVFSEILALLEANYVEDIDNNEIVDGAIRGMLKTLDPHTTYLTPDSYKDMKVETSGKFGGLGIEISMRNGVLTVVSPIDDTPAFNAGIKAKDKIIKIEGESTLDLTLTEAVQKLRGKVGTNVNITVFREGEKKPLEFSIMRDIIKVKSVKFKKYKNKIGYIKIRNFSKTTSQDLDNAIQQLETQGMDKLILDLRNNPGGLLNQAVEVADRFLTKDNLIVYTKGRSDDQNMRFTTHDKDTSVDYPMIIIVNGGSASASEIVAGALQDLGRAIILGTSTFGKGSVQTIIPLTDGSALRLTTARYYTPSGQEIQANGITPDIQIEMPRTKPGVDNDEAKKDKEDSEKEKVRRFLREKDLKKHLKGKSEEDLENEQESTGDVESDELSESQEEELSNDPQLREAVSLLSGWEIMEKTFKRKGIQTFAKH